MPSQRHNNNMLWLGLSDVSEKIGLISVTAVCRNQDPELDCGGFTPHCIMQMQHLRTQIM